LTEAEKRLALDRLAPRGPDAEGVWEAQGVWFGHRRLAVVDLDARANQPMHSPCGRYLLVFNGEIYNFRALRRELDAKYGPIPWRTESDTEVVLAGFLREGEGWFSRLRGMFALAIWDRDAQRLTVARDPLGIKPLYYAEHPRGIAIASTVKTLLALGCDSEPDSRGWACFFLWGAVHDPLTCYRRIRAVEPGHWGQWHAGRWRFQPYVERRQPWEVVRDPDDLAEQVEQAVRDSVTHHLVADVPIGVLLSGGVDSTTVAALSAEAGLHTAGFTVAFPEWLGQPQDESPLAVLVANHYGFQSHVAVVSRTDLVQNLDAILDDMDQPSLDGINTWFATKAVADHGYKVALSGLGGDELFAGYPTFRRVPLFWQAWRVLSGVLGTELALKTCRLYGRFRGRVMWRHVDRWFASPQGIFFSEKGYFYPDEMTSLLSQLGLEPVADEEIEALVLPDPPPSNSLPQSVGMWETWRYMVPQLLRDSDWASMAHGVELRVPLADWPLIQTLAPLLPHFIDRKGKALLAQTPKAPLPSAIVDRRKWGFVIPVLQWLSHVPDWPQSEAIAPVSLERPDRKMALWLAHRWGLGR